MQIIMSELEFLHCFKMQKLPDTFSEEINEEESVQFIVDDHYAGLGKRCADGSILFEQIIVPEDRVHMHHKEHQHIHNHLGLYFANIDEYIEQENQKIEKQAALSRKKRKEMILQASDIVMDEQAHTKAQYLLREMGQCCGVDVWIASNDKQRCYESEPLQLNPVELPDYPISEEIKKRSGLIDTIWFNESQISHAFEIEFTSSIYSGLLRMSDLMLSFPRMPIKMYIVAPMKREEKFLREIRRPSFEYLGMSSKVKFIPLEMLEPLLKKIDGLDGCISADIIEKIAIHM